MTTRTSKARPTLVWLAAGAAGALVLTVVVAAWRVRAAGQSAAESDGFLSSPTPLGGLFGRASAVSQLKQRMGELRAVWPALNEFATGHDGLLPANMVALKPYLPANLASLSDEHWEIPSAGLAARSVMGKNDAVLLQQKGPSPNSARIVVYGDGHIEYRK